MTDTPTQMSDGERARGEEQLVRLVSAVELDRLEARRDHLTATVEELQAENKLLRQEIATLRHRLNQKDQQRQQVIDNYERQLGERRRQATRGEQEALEPVTVLQGWLQAVRAGLRRGGKQAKAALGRFGIS